MKIFAMPGPKKHQLSETEYVNLQDFHLEAPDSWETVRTHYTNHAKLGGPKPLKLIPDGTLGLEAYKIRISQDSILALCGGIRAARYAMEMLLAITRNSRLPLGVVEDYPLLSMRGYQLNLASLRYSDIDDICHLIRMCSQQKINTLLVEYDTRFPYKKYQSVAPWAFSQEEYQKLHACAARENIEIIPLLQTCGHLSFLLSHPELAHIREEIHKPDQLCPTNPNSIKFVMELIDWYVQLHPNAKYFHIGGDETRQLGICKQCADYAAKHGKGGLYVQHMNRVIDYVCAKGLTPMIYDDMVCAHPEAMKDLDRRAVIVYWDYWTTCDPSPLLVARGGGHSSIIVHDKCWQECGYAGLGDLERNILRDFTECCVMEEELKPAYLDLYRKYLGPEFPRFIKAYPYIEYYREQGFKVITMPTTMGNTDNYLGAPNQARFTANIRTCAQRSVEAGLEGMIASTWYLYTEAAYPFGIALAGQYAWGMPENEVYTAPGSATPV